MQRQLNQAREESRAAGGLERLKAYGELAKPRIVLMILLVSVASFHMAGRGSPSTVLRGVDSSTVLRGVDWSRLAAAMAGIGLLAVGILALNQLMERSSDMLMRRTAGRPVPSGPSGQMYAPTPPRPRAG